MKHNFIIDFLAYSETDENRHLADNRKNSDHFDKNKSIMADNSLSISNNTYSINTGYASKIDKLMMSSKISNTSYNPSSKLSFSSVFSSHQGFDRHLNIWNKQDPRNPFDPVKYPFYRRYVVRYTKYRSSFKNKIKSSQNPSISNTNPVN